MAAGHALTTALKTYEYPRLRNRKRAKRLGEVGARGGGTDSTPRIHTPPAFRDLLLAIAQRANADLRQDAGSDRTNVK